MGIFDDLAFGWGSSNKPRVTAKEYKKAKGEMFDQGFSKRDRAKVDQIFGPDYYMNSTSSHPKGLEKSEIEARVKWMRDHKSEHGLSDEKINAIEADFKERL